MVSLLMQMEAVQEEEHLSGNVLNIADFQMKIKHLSRDIKKGAENMPLREFQVYSITLVCNIYLLNFNSSGFWKKKAN